MPSAILDSFFCAYSNIVDSFVIHIYVFFKKNITFRSIIVN